MVEAPLKETLAAAVLALGGARARFAVRRPDGGLGHARDRARARGARHRARPAPPLRFRALADAAARRARRRFQRCAPRPRRRRIAAQRAPLPPIVCGDAAADAIAAARQNASAAGVDDVITFQRADVAALEKRAPAGTVVTNPPYGERLKPEALGGLYRSMARVFERLAGWRVVVLSGSPLWTREMRRKPADLAQAVERAPRGPFSATTCDEPHAALIPALGRPTALHSGGRSRFERGVLRRRARPAPRVAAMAHRRARRATSSRSTSTITGSPVSGWRTRRT